MESPNIYYANDGYDQWEVHADTPEEALAEAVESIRENYVIYDRENWSQKWDVSIYDDDDDCLLTEEVVVNPDPGDCPDADAHSWKRHSGPWGHGAGVTITNKCRHCGLLQHEDTWHLNMSDGTRYEAVKYEEDYSDD